MGIRGFVALGAMHVGSGFLVGGQQGHGLTRPGWRRAGEWDVGSGQGVGVRVSRARRSSAARDMAAWSSSSSWARRRSAGGGRRPCQCRKLGRRCRASATRASAAGVMDVLGAAFGPEPAGGGVG